MKRFTSQGNQAACWIRKVKPIGYSCTLQQEPIYSEIFIWERLISRTVRYYIPTGVLFWVCGSITQVYTVVHKHESQRKKLANLFYHSPSSLETRNRNRASNKVTWKPLWSSSPQSHSSEITGTGTAMPNFSPGYWGFELRSLIFAY